MGKKECWKHTYSKNLLAKRKVKGEILGCTAEPILLFFSERAFHGSGYIGSCLMGDNLSKSFILKNVNLRSEALNGAKAISHF